MKMNAIAALQGKNPGIKILPAGNLSFREFARNKWLITHPDTRGVIEGEAYPGIAGENIQIHLLD